MDHLEWALDVHGGFLVRSLKDSKRNELQNELGYLFQRNSWVLKKVGSFELRAEMKRVPPLFALLKRNVIFQSAICLIYGEESALGNIFWFLVVLFKWCDNLLVNGVR